MAENEPAFERALVEELDSVKLKLAASCFECANFLWKTQDVFINTRKAENAIAGSIAEVSKELIGLTIRHVAIAEKEMANALKRVSTHKEMKSKAAVFPYAS